MRSYIFTPLERKIINDFFKGRVSLTNDVFRQIRSRLVRFRDLESDVQLYLKLQEAISTRTT